ncbi:hypothetical protein BC628DRAFT_1336155 [Trametes gibbosa]|nr:hypothetical protein BC628DRAFT_1336155 [Trametes gibbosa]
MDCATTSVPSAANLMSVTTPQKINLGAILLGCVVQSVFYGNSLLLTWRFYRKGRGKDPWCFKAADHRLVRMLYVYRLAKLCYTLSYFRGRVISAALLVLTVILCVVELGGVTQSPERRYIVPLFYLIFATGLSADIILTGMMCLWLHSARTGLHRTDTAINTMILYAIETGLLPSLVETGGMIAFLVAPQTQIFIAFYIQISVLYLNSLLTSLGTRRLVQRRIQQPISLNFSILNASLRGVGPTDTTPDASLGDLDAVDGAAPSPLRLLDEQIAEKAAALDIERGQSEQTFGPELSDLELLEGRRGSGSSTSPLLEGRRRRASTMSERSCTRLWGY